jgi:drug/metabolite transporter (DMT)-like permease
MLTVQAGAIAAIGTSVCWSFTALFFSFGGRRIGADAVNRTRLLFAIGLYAVAHTLAFGVPYPAGVAPWRVGWLALSALLGLVIGDGALFQAYVLVGPRLGMLMMSLVPIIGTVLARVFLGESVSATEVAGIALTVGGVAWVVSEPGAAGQRISGRDYRIGLLLGAVGAFGQAANLIAARFALVGDFPALTASFVRILVAAAVLWGLSLARRDTVRIVRQWRDRRAIAAVFGGAVVGPFAGISLSLYAVQHTRIGIASTLMALPPVLLIPLEFLVHGRRTSRRGVLGTVVAILGVALLFLPGR